MWPGIFAGAFLANLTTAGTAATSLGIALGNTLEAIAGGWVLNRLGGGRHALEGVRSIAIFVPLVALGSTAISATFGVTSLHLGGFVPDYSATWLTWWLGDMVSDLIIAPLLLIWSTKRFSYLMPLRLLELSLALGFLILIAQMVFHGWFKLKNYPLEYLAIPPLLWTAFRFTHHGASLSAFILSAIAISGTVGGFGPFALPDPNESLLLLQLFMGTMAVTGLVLAVVVAEREQAGQFSRVQSGVGGSGEPGNRGAKNPSRHWWHDRLGNRIGLGFGGRGPTPALRGNLAQPVDGLSAIRDGNASGQFSQRCWIAGPYLGAGRAGVD
jgi:integral membrane sensor domain MASE1